MEKKKLYQKIFNVLLHLLGLNKYDRLQENEISLAKAKGLDTSVIENAKFNWMQMREIRLGLEKNLDVSTYAKPDLNVEQMEEIRLGLEKGLDVSFYNKPDFSWLQMHEIRLGLEKNLDVSTYAKPDLDADQMEEIRLGLERGIDVSYYNTPSYDRRQMREIRLGLENNVDISFYEDASLDWRQMREIRLGMEQGVNIFEYLGKSFTEMKKNRLEMLQEKAVFNGIEYDTSYRKNNPINAVSNDKVTNVKHTVEPAIKNEKNEKPQVREEHNNAEDFKLTKFDVGVLFKEFVTGAYTERGLKNSLMMKYKDVDKAESEFLIYKRRIDKLIENGYVSIEDGKYVPTEKGLSEAKNINTEFKFTSYDSTVIFGHILRAGGELSLSELKTQLKSEYKDEKEINSQYKYIENRLNDNCKKGYIKKNESNTYSITPLGYKEAGKVKALEKANDMEKGKANIEVREAVEID